MKHLIRLAPAILWVGPAIAHPATMPHAHSNDTWPVLIAVAIIVLVGVGLGLRRWSQH